MPASKPMDSLYRVRWVGRIFQMEIRKATAITSRTKVSRRLPNSMIPWMPISGTGVIDPGTQLGHWEQPRPDSVSLTAPPVTIMPIWEIRDAIARACTRRVTFVGSLSAQLLEARTEDIGISLLKLSGG